MVERDRRIAKRHERLMGYWEERYKQVKAKGGNFDTMICWSAVQYLAEKMQVCNEIKKFLEGLQVGNVLDFGCGCGRFCDLFDPASYTGMDVIPELIAENKEKYPAKTWDDLSSEPLKLKYDLIFCFTVLQHLPEEEFLMRLANFREIGKNLFIGESMGVANNVTWRRAMIKVLQDNGYDIKNQTIVHLQENYHFIWAVPNG